MKAVGVIGGLGPMATIYYLEQVTKMTDAKKDQEHLKILMESIPDTPDRTHYILEKKGTSPLPSLIKAGQELTRLGAGFLAIPCVTAHYFYEPLCGALQIPVLSLCEDTAIEMSAKKIKRAGILATEGTIQSRVLEQVFEKYGIESVYPDSSAQQLVMEMIYGKIKKGTFPDREDIQIVKHSLLEKGAQKIVLGCTELSLLKKEYPLDTLYVDMLEILAQKTVLFSGAPLKEAYKNLIQ
ncbi:MAG: aspartate/glutamate racemase family protein [Eubacterium sp.]|nr:aspartate/glutamate racemase family protein [Eubacterium sp.]